MKIKPFGISLTSICVLLSVLICFIIRPVISLITIFTGIGFEKVIVILSNAGLGKTLIILSLKVLVLINIPSSLRLMLSVI